MILTALSTYISYWRFRKHIEAAGLFYSHYIILEVLSHTPNISAEEVSEATKMERVPALMKVRALKGAGLIKVSGEYRKPGGRGRASKLYSLTEGGRLVLNKVEEELNEPYPKAA